MINSDRAFSEPVAIASGIVSDIAIVNMLRTGCRDFTPAWGLRPHTPVLTDLLTAIKTPLDKHLELQGQFPARSAILQLRSGLTLPWLF